MGYLVDGNGWLWLLSFCCRALVTIIDLWFVGYNRGLGWICKWIGRVLEIGPINNNKRKNIKIEDFLWTRFLFSIHVVDWVLK